MAARSRVAARVGIILHRDLCMSSVMGLRITHRKKDRWMIHLSRRRMDLEE